MDEVLTLLLTHWPAVMFTLVVTVLAQVMKTRIFTKDLAKKYSVVFWLRRVYPILILSLGVVAGLTWPGEVASGISETAPKIWYFTGCSGASIIGFNIFKQWGKRKYDVDISANGGL